MIKAAIAIVLAGAGLLFLLAAGVMGSSRTAPAPITGADARSGPFVKAYGNIIQHVEYGVTPESVAATADGGYVAVGSATSSGQNGFSGALILKLDGAGTVQWQRKLGPTGSTIAYFNAVQQTSDGGYVAIGEYSVLGGSYPYPVSVLVVTFDPSGNVRWQRGFNNVDDQGSPSGYDQALAGIQTSDGGYLAAGNWSKNPPSPFPEEDSAGVMLLKVHSGGQI